MKKNVLLITITIITVILLNALQIAEEYKISKEFYQILLTGLIIIIIINQIQNNIINKKIKKGITISYFFYLLKKIYEIYEGKLKYLDKTVLIEIGKYKIATVEYIYQGVELLKYGKKRFIYENGVEMYKKYENIINWELAKNRDKITNVEEMKELIITIKRKIENPTLLEKIEVYNELLIDMGIYKHVIVIISSITIYQVIRLLFSDTVCNFIQDITYEDITNNSHVVSAIDIIMVNTIVMIKELIQKYDQQYNEYLLKETIKNLEIVDIELSTLSSTEKFLTICEHIYIWIFFF